MSAQYSNNGAISAKAGSPVVSPSKSKLFSAALFKENFKRFWPMEIVAFLIYFLSGPYIIISDGYSRYFVRTIVNNTHIIFLGMSLIMPVICCAEVFNYLNIPAAANLVHTQPFSRRTLFITNFLSGYAMTLAPAAATAVILMILSAAMKGSGDDISYGPLNFAVWLLTAAVVMLFVYAVSALASAVSGTTIIQILTSFAFNFLPAALYVSFVGYANTFSFGYSTGSNFEDWIRVFNPWTVFISTSDMKDSEFFTALLVYGIAGIALAAFAMFVYSKRPLERTGDSYVFIPVQWVIGFLISFFASTLVGLILYDSFSYAGFIFGGAIGFIASQMIVRKTLRIMDRQTAKAALVFILVMVLIIGGFALDILGISRYTPSVQQIENASVNCIVLNNGRYAIFASEQDLATVVSLHRDILSNRRNLDKNSDMTLYAEIMYKLKNGKTVMRHYNLPVSYLETSREMESLYNSTRPDAGKIMSGFDFSRFEVYTDNYDASALDTQDKMALIKAVLQDKTIITYRENLRPYKEGTSADEGEYVCWLDVTYKEPVRNRSNSQMEEHFAMVPGFQYWYEEEEGIAKAGYNYNITTKSTPALYEWFLDMKAQGKLK